MDTLRTQLSHLADRFVSSVLAAMRSAPLSELADAPAPSRPRNGAQLRRGPGRPARAQSAEAQTGSEQAKGGRRKRSSSEEVERQKNLALATAKTLGPGFSKGEATKKAKSAVDLGRALSLLVAEGKLKRRGDRRLARYWVS